MRMSLCGTIVARAPLRKYRRSTNPGGVRVCRDDQFFFIVSFSFNVLFLIRYVLQCSLGNDEILTFEYYQNDK